MEPIHSHASLGPLRPEDYEVFYELFTHEKLVPFLPEQAIPKSPADAVKEMKYLMDKEWQGNGKYWGIYHNNHLIGTAGLHTLVEHNQSIEISYELHPDYWGYGIATCAAIYCVEYARIHMLNVKKILAYTLVDNIGSHRVAEKAGFKRVGIRQNDCFYHGQLIDRVLFAITIRPDDPS